jgi:hypothetical protein
LCYFSLPPRPDGGGTEGSATIKVKIDSNSVYEDITEQLYRNLPWTNPALSLQTELPLKPDSSARIFLQLGDKWCCNKSARLGELGYKHKDKPKLYVILTVPYFYFADV